MAISITGSGKLHVAANSTWTMPSGVCNSGDVLLLAVSSNNGSPSGKYSYNRNPAAPSGWTSLVSAPTSGTTGQVGTASALMWKIASASDAAGTASYAMFDNGSDVIFSVIGLGGANTSTPFESVSSFSAEGSAAAETASGSAGASTDMAIGLYTVTSPTTGLYTGASVNNGFTIQTNSLINQTMTNNAVSANGHNRSSLFATKQLSASGAVGTTTLTAANTGTWISYMLFLTVAGGGPVGHTQNFSATLSFASSEQRAITHGITATESFTSSEQRAVGKNLAATAQFQSSQQRSIAKTISAALSFASGQAKGVVHALAATLGFTGTAQKNAGKNLTGTVTVVGSQQKGVGKTIAATLAPVSSIGRAIAKGMRSILTFIGSLPLPGHTPPTTPASRIYVVPADPRGYTIPADVRTYVVPTDNRTYIVEAQ